jgi:hypothetical protein
MSSTVKSLAMKRTNIYLDEDQLRLLRHLAVEQDRSFTAIVREALDDYLVRQGLATAPRVQAPRLETPNAAWRARLDDVLGRLRSQAPPELSAAEIESEITAALRDVRAARRRPSSG